MQNEVLMPPSAVHQLKTLVNEQKVQIVHEEDLHGEDRVIYDATYKKLEQVMMNPRQPHKNKGEVCSLAYAKTVGIPYFATEEQRLQPIIDKQLNTDLENHLTCIHIADVVRQAYIGEIQLTRKTCKAMWLAAGYRKEVFDQELWPLQNT